MTYSLQLIVAEMAACTLTREESGIFLIERLALSITQTETYAIQVTLRQKENCSSGKKVTDNVLATLSGNFVQTHLSSSHPPVLLHFPNL